MFALEKPKTGRFARSALRTIEVKPDAEALSEIWTIASTPWAARLSAASGSSVGRSAAAATSSIPTSASFLVRRSRK